MNLLFIDTSYDFILVSIHQILNNEIKTTYSFKQNCPRESSYRLVSDIEIALQKTNITRPDLIACGIGPGSFTGIRISVSTARNFSQLWKIPILGIDSLELYSYYYSDHFNKNILMKINGRQNRIFSGYFENVFLGSHDSKVEEVESLYTLNNFITVSDIQNLPDSFYIYENLPDAKVFFENKFFSLKFENDYEKILPKYMRDSYAKK